MGTPALTTLGMGKEEMREIADIILSVLKATKPTIVEKTGLPSKANSVTEEKVKKSAQDRVGKLLSRYPLYPEIEIS